MTALKKLRTQLGLSQSAFADLLNCSPGQLSMAESGLRNLPATALQHIAAIERELTAVIARRPANTNKKQDNKVAALLDKHIRTNKNALERLQASFDKVNEKQQQADRFLQWTQAFLDSPFLPDIGEVHLRMNILQRQTEKKLHRYAEENIRLQLKMAGLRAEIEKANELTIYQHN